MNIGKLVYFDDDSGLAFGIDFDRYVFDRWEYTFKIAVMTDDFRSLDAVVVSTTVRSRCTTPDAPKGLGKMLATAINFFSAYVEAVDTKESGRNDHPENLSLFDGATVEGAPIDTYGLALNVSSDHLSGLVMNLQGSLD